MTCCFERRPLFLEVGYQFAQRFRIHHRARKNVRADARAFFDDGDLHVAESVAAGTLFVLFDEFGEVERAGQIGWTSAHKYNVKF